MQEIIDKLNPNDLFKGTKKKSIDGFVIVDAVNKLLEGLYRISYSWCHFHVYKIYEDDREHHLKQFIDPMEMFEFLKEDLKNA